MPGKILMVANDEAQTFLIQTTFQEANWQVYKTVSIEHGLSVLADNPYDLLLLDLDLDLEQGNGVSMLQQVREQNPELAVIVVTAHPSVESAVAATRCHVFDYLAEPYELSYLVERAKEARQEQLAHQALQAELEDLRQLNRDKDKFFSIVAHDLSGAFQSILLASEFLSLMSKDSESSRIEQIGKNIYLSAKQINELLQNLLQWSRVQSGRMEHEPTPLSLSELVEKSLSLLSESAKNKQISLNNHLSDEIAVYADENMLHTVIRNLISNAIKFTPAGGKVMLSAMPVSASEQPFVEFAVSDTGIGMSEEKQTELFRVSNIQSTPGTAEEVGTGFGLILCQEMVERNGGEIWIESQLNKGTTVKLTIPQSIART